MRRREDQSHFNNINFKNKLGESTDSVPTELEAGNCPL